MGNCSIRTERFRFNPYRQTQSFILDSRLQPVRNPAEASNPNILTTQAKPRESAKKGWVVVATHPFFWNFPLWAE